MAPVVTIDRPDVVALIEAMAERHTNGDKTEAVALALRQMQVREERVGSLFGRMRGSVTVMPGVDLTAPTFEDEPPSDAETGRELLHR